MRKLSIFILAAIFSLGLATIVDAQELKIGYVDSIKVFNEFQKTKDYDKELQEKQTKREQERDKKIEELKKLQDQYVLLSDAEKEKKKEEIEKKARELDEFRRSTVTDLRQKQGDFMQEIVEEIDKEVQKQAEAQGLDFVLSSQSVLYIKDSFDITDSVLKELNKNYKK